MPLPPFSGLPGAYGAILADPPWAFRTYGGDDATPHRTEIDHYPVLSIADLKALPVGSLAAKDCVLFMWVVDTHLDQAFPVAEAWGFKYKTRAFEWDKGSIGMGYWTRKEGESCLLFTRGKPARLNADVRQFIREKRRNHSQKPDETYNRIERLVAGPYVELFARQRWPGWSGWGNEYPLSLEQQMIRLASLIDRLCDE